MATGLTFTTLPPTGKRRLKTLTPPTRVTVFPIFWALNIWDMSSLRKSSKCCTENPGSQMNTLKLVWKTFIMPSIGTPTMSVFAPPQCLKKSTLPARSTDTGADHAYAPRIIPTHVVIACTLIPTTLKRRFRCLLDVVYKGNFLLTVEFRQRNVRLDVLEEALEAFPCVYQDLSEADAHIDVCWSYWTYDPNDFRPSFYPIQRVVTDFYETPRHLWKHKMSEFLHGVSSPIPTIRRRNSQVTVNRTKADCYNATSD